jgi:hypothetical protein
MHHELSTKKLSSAKCDEVIKLSDATDDIDALMLQASKTVPQKSEDMVAEKPKRHHTKKYEVSKRERALLKKLNKL